MRLTTKNVYSDPRPGLFHGLGTASTMAPRLRSARTQGLNPSGQSHCLPRRSQRISEEDRIDAFDYIGRNLKEVALVGDWD